MKVIINFSKRWLYTLIAIGILAIIGIGVYAVAGVSHSPEEIEGLGALATKDSINWTEISNRPAGLDDGDDGGEVCPSGMKVYTPYQNLGEDSYLGWTWGTPSNYYPDTCNGDESGEYTCPADVSKTCKDLARRDLTDYYWSRNYRWRRDVTCERRTDLQCEDL